MFDTDDPPGAPFRHLDPARPTLDGVTVSDDDRALILAEAEKSDAAFGRVSPELVLVDVRDNLAEAGRPDLTENHCRLVLREAGLQV